jgi:hypothetical protein
MIESLIKENKEIKKALKSAMDVLIMASLIDKSTLCKSEAESIEKILKKYKFLTYIYVKKIGNLIQLGRCNKLICIGPIKLEVKFFFIYLIIKISKI